MTDTQVPAATTPKIPTRERILDAEWSVGAKANWWSVLLKYLAGPEKAAELPGALG